MKKKVFRPMILILGIAFFLSGCAEHRYYHTYHHHSPGYSRVSHKQQSSGVGIDINL
jgi:PBP1b-binding outer membrane lipoprotein LpoB